MAYLPHGFSSASKTFVPKFPYYDTAAAKSLICFRKFHETDRRRGNRSFPVIVRSSSTETVSGLIRNGEIKDFEEIRETELQYLASEHGWNVRRLVEDDREEIRRVSLVQAEAFHTPVPLFDDFFFLLFKAEVLSGLLYKLRNSPPGRYACLVGEPASDSEASESTRGIVGVVDVTVLRDASVIRHFPDVEEYLYVSGLAVSKSLRRRRVGSTLLKACDVMCFLWGFKLLALRAYENDEGARKLYSNAGYRVISADPPWTTTWIGRKRRVLMIKQFP